jgi:hypothetical protein
VQHSIREAGVRPVLTHHLGFASKRRIYNGDVRWRSGRFRTKPIG